MTSTMTRSKNEQGFTAVELLVIVAIIFILMLLLLPVLQRMKMKGLDTVCMSNLKQFGLAGNMYWADNDGKSFPYRGDQLDDGQIYWFGWLQSGTEGERRFDAAKGVLHPYIDAEGVQVCPRLDFINDRFKLKATGAAYGYGYNLHLAGGMNSNPVLMESIKSPSDIVFLADAAQVNTFQAPASRENPMIEEFYYVNDREKTTHFRHGEKSYAVFCDGSVSLQTYAEGSIDDRMPDQWVGRLPSAMLQVSPVPAAEVQN
ncbi:MAG: hypothetical protein CMO63_01620 [Verrucomicrobiales bacterium]|nr:hypothetical protein [Verrucomicrobiales bacterium]